ncbi:MAG: PAS domain S-box protein, partial [Rhodothermaceae bacterium]
ITETKLAELTLKNERDRAEKYFNTADALLLILSPNEKIIDINDMGCKILGFKKSELLGKNWFENFLGDEERENHKQNFYSLLENPGTDFSEETKQSKPQKVLCKNKVKYIKWSSALLYNNKNEVIGMLNSGQDFTRHIEDSKVLHYYETMISLINDPMALYDKDFNYLAVNNAYCRLFSKSEKDFVNHNVKSNYSEDYYKTVLEPIYESCLKGKDVKFQIWFTFPKFGTRYMDVTYYPVKNDEGEVQFFITTGKDLTNEKRIQESLIESEKKYKTLVESSPTPIIVYVENKIVFANNIAVETLGGDSTKDILDQNVFNFIHPDYHKIVKKKKVDPEYNSHLSTDVLEEKFIRLDGRIIDVEVASSEINFNGKEATQLFFHDISVRKKAEEDLRKSHDFHLTLFDDFPALIWRSDKDFNMNYFNKTWLNFTGRKLYEEKGEGWMNGVHPDDLRIVTSYMYMFKRREAFEIAYRHKRFDGEYRWLNNFGRPYYNIKGEFSGFIGACFDITARMNLEAALRNSKEKYRKFFEEDLSANYVCNIQGDILECNKSFINLFGFASKKEVEKTNARDIFVSSTQFDELVNELQTKEQLASLENKKIKTNGDIFDTVENIVGIFNEHKQLVKLRTYLVDNTKQKKAQQELFEYKNQLELLVQERTQNLEKVNLELESKIKQEQTIELKLKNQLSFLKTLLDSIPNPVFIKNRKQVLLDCNSAFERFFGMPKNQIIGLPLSQFPNPQNSKEFTTFEKDLLKTASSGSIEFQVIINGEVREILINELTFFRSDGSIGGLVGIITDITKQKNLEREIRNAFQQEKELSEMKSRFISTASHEFRTPLTSILASADLLEMFGRNWDDGKYFEHTTKIQSAVQVMTELLDDVLIVSRAETGKLMYVPDNINLHELCLQLINDAKLSHGLDHQIDFKYNSDKLFVNLDKKLLRYILLNLLSNSIKYSPSTLAIKFEVNFYDKFIQFVIEDKGIGIPESDQSKLFEPFHRAENIGNISGTGLGLSIVLKAVELHKGKITFTSEENKGTKFIIRLPLEEVAVEENCNN